MWSSIRPLRRLLSLPLLYTLSYIFSLLNAAEGAGGGDLWPLDRPDGMPSIQSLEVMCGKDHMDVHLTFSQPFEGIVSSKGQHGDPRCVYVPPSTGQTFFSFRIAYARCGTKPDLHGQFYENTVVVQYDKDLLEVWDEAKRLRCEWFNDYEKTASKPPMVIADLDVIQLDFRGDNVDCWMEIQHGKGPWAPPVSGIVPLGSTLTLVVAINDYRGEFDMRVKSCMASDGGGHVIQLSDEFGCVLRPKMISRFLKARGADERASVITYAFFHAFKFPDALSVHIKCKVEICRHGCLDHCQLQPENGVPDLNNHYNVGPLDRKDEKIVDGGGAEEKHRLPDPVVDNEEEDEEDVVDVVAGDGGKVVDEESLVYDDIIHEETAIKMPLNGNNHHHDGDDDISELDITALPHKDMLLHDQFPHGPRTFEDNDAPLLPSPRSFSDDINKQSTINTSEKEPTTTTTAQTTQQQSTRKRRKRSVVISDRKVRSADVGVSGLYEVISEADLAFSPDNRAEAVTVFQGRIREEVVYGICMPVPGFSVLFVLVAVSAVVSALVAGTLLYRYQLQKEHFAQQQQQHDTTTIPLSLFSGWMGLRLLRTRNNPSTSGQQATNANGTDSSVVVNGKTEQNKRALRDLD